MKEKSKTQSKKAARQQDAVQLDLPQDGEKISSLAYSFRVTAAPTAEKVELRLNKGHWLPCRQQDGFWWYDWATVAPGKYKVRARAHCDGDGHLRVTKTEQRRFKVVA